MYVKPQRTYAADTTEDPPVNKKGAKGGFKMSDAPWASLGAGSGKAVGAAGVWGK